MLETAAVGRASSAATFLVDGPREEGMTSAVVFQAGGLMHQFSLPGHRAFSLFFLFQGFTVGSKPLSEDLQELLFDYQ